MGTNSNTPFTVNFEHNFIELRDYVKLNEIDSAAFGPSSTPPFLWVIFYKNGEVFLKALLSQALQNDADFYDRLINKRDLSGKHYKICLNGYNGYNYLTEPGFEGLEL